MLNMLSLNKTSQGLCKLCSTIDIEKLNTTGGFQHIWTGESSEKCRMCYMIYGTFGTDGKEKGFPIRFHISRKELRTGFLAASLVITGLEHQETFISTVTLHEDPAETQYAIPTCRQLNHSGSETTTEISRKWLNYCLANHFFCGKPLFAQQKLSNVVSSKPLDESAITGTTWSYPTRVLDLNAFSADSLDLRLSHDLVPGNAYSTLSHCWGKKSNPKWRTIKSTLEQHMKRIRYDDIPKTFQDAVSISRKLGIRYLWIDSLCIVQDSDEDWKREASSMAYVYSNSILTISADWSPNSEGGCFKHAVTSSSLNTDRLIRITNTLSDGRESTLYFFTEYPPDEFILDKTTLSTRAWCFQERLLSPRILHYTEDQLFWECREAFGGEDLMPRFHGRLPQSNLIQMYEASDADNVLRKWYQWIVPYYSAAKLTVPTDRLPAISALARLFSERMESRYLSGLWEKGLWYSLCWYCVDSQSRERSKDYIAPSWSWASVNAAVRWDWFAVEGHLDPMAKIEHTDVKYDLDPFGQVSHGWIQMKAPLIHGQNLSDLHKQQIFNVIHLDYPWEISDMAYQSVTYVLLAEHQNKTERLFLILIPSSRHPNMYERFGCANFISQSPLQPLRWSEWDITIV